MNTENFISLNTLSSHYQVDISFFNTLVEMGLIEVEVLDQSFYIQQDKITVVEKMIRLHHELEVNVEGIDVVFNLLERIQDLQNELMITKNRLRLYES
ncbi:chaperone modulator CbpM [Pedobacter cryophilus]|uniref:MerR family transcriptional regulator n=1 Tax=Pedobacter cryophilus TaxID=2571271 RepID=A0A4U1C518_9SPHI|nr:chaperone modulator CbpM [Pedobacter cryophilus]TKC00422.1 MerR family transcriptional regulator [Pedobacter cryophilus]